MDLKMANFARCTTPTLHLESSRVQMSVRPPFRRFLTEPIKASTSAYRNFHVPYVNESDEADGTDAPRNDESSAALIEQCRAAIIGNDTIIKTPFGSRRIIYGDWTASGRALSFIEDYIAQIVLPLYANTHTSSSVTGLQSSIFRRDARQLVSRSCHANDHDVVIFAGSGSTAAIHVFLATVTQTSTNELFAVISVLEHHSMLLPLREYGYTVYTVQMDANGVDIDDLRRICALASKSAVRLGMFSACSNISGIMTDTEAIAEVLNEFGFYSLFDYASAAPYVPMDMNPKNDPRLAKTAIVCSPHKFLGGPSTAGVLVVKKSALDNDVPNAPGGGTVFFVTRNSHRYLKQHEEREEGGTPDIVAAVRTGLVFQLKDAIGAEYILRHEMAFSDRVRTRLQQHKQVVILDGGSSAPKLPIVSFLIRHSESGLFLNHHFISVLLNDMFGIQSRSGCMCAVPYGMELLEMTDDVGAQFEEALVEKFEFLRPGYTRLSWHYTLDEATADGLIDAILFIADNGWKLLPLYHYIPISGEWRQKDVLTKWTQSQSLLRVRYTPNGIMTFPTPLTTIVEAKEPIKDLKSLLVEMQEFVDNTVSTYEPVFEDELVLPLHVKPLKWFITPNEALELLLPGLHHRKTIFNICPFKV